MEESSIKHDMPEPGKRAIVVEKRRLTSDKGSVKEQDMEINSHIGEDQDNQREINEYKRG